MSTKTKRTRVQKIKDVEAKSWEQIWKEEMLDNLLGKLMALPAEPKVKTAEQKRNDDMLADAFVIYLDRVAEQRKKGDTSYYIL
jgi:hypothetical protein